MKKLCTFMALLAVLFLYTGTGFATGLLTEDFNYTAGDAITSHGWNVTGTTALPIITVSTTGGATGLAYTGYANSNIGLSVTLTSGEDDNKLFTGAAIINSGTAYVAAMVKVTSATATGDYFFHFFCGGTTYYGRFFVKSTTGGYFFGISKYTEAAQYETTVRTFGTTYLVVLKYTFNTGTTTDDQIAFFVNPTLASEPTPVLAFTATTADIGTTGITGISLRQGGGTTAPLVCVDGINAGTTWGDAVKALVPTLAAAPTSITGLTYIVGAGPSQKLNYSLSGSNLTGSGNIYIVAPDSFRVSTDNTNFYSDVNVAYTGPTLSATTIYVQMKSGLAVGNYGPLNIKQSGGGVTEYDVPVSGFVDASQQLTASTHTINTGLDYYYGAGPSTPAQTFNLSGSSLTGFPGVITVTAPANFEVSKSLGSGFANSVTVAYTSATLTSTPIYVRLAAGLAGGTYGPLNVACTGGGALEEDVAVTGNVLVQSLTLTETGSNIVHMSYLLGADSTGAEEYFLVGANLSGYPGNITVNAPANFVVSNALYGTYGSSALVPYTSATLASTGVFVKLAHGLAVGSYSGNLSWSGGGLSSQTLAISGVVSAASTTLFNEDFSYATGNLAGTDGWVAHSSPGSNPIQIVTPGLTYPGLTGSGVGNAVSMLTGEDCNHQFTNVNSGSVYASAMVNVSSATTTGDYFIHFSDGGTYDFYARTFVVANGAGFNFGISKYNGAKAIESTVRNFGQTYLVVIKYNFVAGALTDYANLFINPAVGGSEPVADLTTDVSVNVDAVNISGIFLRQGGGTSAPAVKVDGIKVGTTWGSVTPAAGCTLNLTALYEAMYLAGGTAMLMTPAVTVELHDASTLAVVESKTGTLSTAGVTSLLFTTVSSGTPYYLGVKSPNTVETWSANTVTFTAGALTYDFTTGTDKAYTDGSNPSLVNASGKFCMYSGDVNQDGYVTGDDYTGVDNDNFNYDYHVVNDVNGDGYVTGDDYTSIDNNNFIYVQRQVPPGAPSHLVKRVKNVQHTSSVSK